MKILRPDRIDRLPDAILLDTDNTLYSYNPAHAAAHKAVSAKAVATLSITSEVFEKALTEARAQTKKQLEGLAASHSRLLYMQKMFEILGLRSQPLMALDFEQTYWRVFLLHAKLFPGVKELMDELRLLGIPIAIVTDLTAQIQFRKMVFFGLDSYFDYIVTSEEAGRDKPDPRPFHLALEKMKPLGDRIWMIGDNPEADIRGAKAAINAVTFQKLHEGVTLGDADVTFESFDDLKRLLQKLGKIKP